jgi:quinol monooxygenase YgiN
MVAISENEPETLGYHFLLSADHTRCRLVEGYTDAAAITAHFNGPAVQQFVPQLLQVATPTRMEIYGDLGPQVAAMAAAFGAEIFTAWQGFDR